MLEILQHKTAALSVYVTLYRGSGLAAFSWRHSRQVPSSGLNGDSFALVFYFCRCLLLLFVQGRVLPPALAFFFNQMLCADHKFQPWQKSRPWRRTAKVQTSFAGFFDYIICDKGHKVKTILTCMHQSISQLKVCNVCFLMVTPLFNKVLDICGYLAILYKDTFEETTAEHPKQTADDPIEEYKAFSHLDTPLDPPPYHLLSPKKFAMLAMCGHLTAREGYYTLPIIMRLIFLHYAMGDLLDGGCPGQCIGDEIPKSNIVTVELRYPKRVQTAHDPVYHMLVACLRPKARMTQILSRLCTVWPLPFLWWDFSLFANRRLDRHILLTQEILSIPMEGGRISKQTATTEIGPRKIVVAILTSPLHLLAGFLVMGDDLALCFSEFCYFDVSTPDTDC